MMSDIELSLAHLDEDDAFEPVYLEPSQVHLWRLDSGTIRLTLGQRMCYRRVTIRRVRPLSDPDGYIALWAGDDREIGIIRRVDALAAVSQAVVTEALEKRYHTPQVRRIRRIIERFGVQQWTVETDLGVAEFFVRGINQSIRRLPPDRMLISDVRNNRYNIADVSALDTRSTLLLTQYL